MLSLRQRKVLKWIVEEYVRTAEPVGSKALAGLPEFVLSSATIRNEMATLEDMGLILKTHTSSGRVPSEEGYRMYVQDIIDQQINGWQFPMIDEIFSRDLLSREQAVKETMAMVTELTNYASIALGGAAYKARIKRLQFVPLTEAQAVILMVTDQGYVESKKIIIPSDVDIKDIERVIGLLNETLFDCPIADIEIVLRERLDHDQIRDTIDFYDELVALFVRAFSSMAQDKFFMSGQTHILAQPEFQNINKIRELMNSIERQEIFKVVNLNKSGITVKIGRENEIKSMEDCTVISVSYENDFGERGAIAVIGPTRMEYQKVIPLLEYISKYLKKL